MIVAVEGVSFSGKSRMCSQAQKDGFTLIKEPSEYAKGSFIRAIDIESACQNITETLIIERQRATDAFEAVKRGENIVLDRSVFSLMALTYAYSYKKYTGLFTEIANEVGQALSDGRFVLPTHLVLLKPSLAVLREREKKRVNHFPHFWLSEDFVEAQYKIYNMFAQIYQQNGRLLQKPVFVEEQGMAELSRQILDLFDYCKSKNFGL